MLLVLVMLAGRNEPIIWPPMTMLPSEVGPQLFFIKVVPSPSLIVRWFKQEPVEEYSMSNVVNCKDRINPCSTTIVSVLSRLLG